MKKPNGYGSIKKLSGNRRRPFVFVVSVDGKQKPIEFIKLNITKSNKRYYMDIK